MVYRATAKTEANKTKQRQAIIKAARNLMARGGFAAVSIQAVATEAEVAIGSVYRHFDSKADLCAEIFRQATQREVDVIGETTTRAGTAIVRLAAAAEAFCQRAMKGPIQAYALIAEPVDPAVDIERIKYREAYGNIFRQLIEDGMAQGVFPPQDARVSAAALVGALAETLVGPLAMHLRRNDEFPADEQANLVHHATLFCLRAIAGQESNP
jgi:AcrR family transcriptional regulator